MRDGRKHVDSPIKKLMKEHGVGEQYPKRLYDKVLASGSVASKPRSGRPELFSPGCWEQMVGIIREFRTKQRVASTRSISSQLTKKITPAYLLKISKKVRGNMLKVIDLKGGNFYKD